MADQSADAYEKLVDRLLASPHYGERWARHWLDAAGYADSEGGAMQDAVRTWAFKYRDYVIRAFNADKPFDRFLHEQLAGDELAGAISGDLSPAQIELLTATGFLRMAADGTASGDNSPEARNQVVADTLKIVTSSLLGLTVACAQCHDHRYDPIPQTDYYALRAVFEPALDWQAWKTPNERQVSLYTAADRQRAAEIEAEAQKIAAERAAKQAVYMAEALEKELTKYEEPLRSELRAAYQTAADKRSDAQKQLLDKYPSVNISEGVLYQYNQAAADDLKKFDERIAAVRAKKPAEEFLRVLIEPPAHVPETKLFHRGDYRQPMQTIAPGTLSVCSPESGRTEFAAKSADLPTTGRRLAFARWLTGPDNPLNGTGDRQSRVDASLRPRHCCHAGGFWPPGNAALASSVARLAGRGTARLGLEPEAPASRDHAFHGVSPVVAARAGSDRHRCRESLLRSAECCAARCRNAARPGAGGDRSARSHAVRSARRRQGR